MHVTTQIEKYRISPLSWRAPEAPKVSLSRLWTNSDMQGIISKSYASSFELGAAWFYWFFNVRDYVVKDFPFTEEDQDSQNVMHPCIMWGFLLWRIFPSVLSEIRKTFYHSLLNLLVHQNAFPVIVMLKWADYFYQFLISKRFYYNVCMVHALLPVSLHL